MLNAIGFLIKVAAFASLVLVMGSWAKWDGKTLSERVQDAVAQAERSDTASKIREWSRTVASDAREGAEKRIAAKPGARHHAAAKKMNGASEDRTETASAAPNRAYSENSADSEKEKIPSSERQKLRELIRELNSSN